MDIEKITLETCYISVATKKISFEKFIDIDSTLYLDSDKREMKKISILELFFLIK